ncbi:TonB-dependent receptor plug domain-containing protein [Hymenobacter sp. BT683]|uniref:TonB-dependent receptor plug domain-containing protein n=1 Tax=Hymenobacter jeongseonensis TaxID=2791027 RepID=A0ABS0IDL4_9BACT|nr:TonB-dependent receptor plug domain-containing protein [Hymenobacter jeongseonensis]MBF9236444.1 TonB-dependent receptor plug domain-containing protein [Hymenobacter jeongseonensis]
MKRVRVQKEMLAFLLVSGLMLSAFRPLPTEEGLMQRIARQLGEFYAAARGEKVYLHLDRPVYATGETIWFSAYQVDASQHRLDSLSQVLHVDLVSADRKVVARRTLHLQGGRASGDLAIADSLAAGTYVLRAYTNWMRNAGDNYVYSRRLSIWLASPLGPQESPAAAPGAASAKTKSAAAAAAKPDVQFFPEGGYLVEGLPAVVACKATDASGRSLAVRGQILNAQNAVVVSGFASRHAGMGRFAFVPGSGQRYHARLTLPNGSTADYPLPAVQPTGYSLHVVETADNFLVEVRYRGPAEAPAPGPVQLLTQVRGVVAYPGARTPTGSSPAVWQMPKKNYPNGIIHFTLFDAEGSPKCERLAFVQNGPAALNVTITADQPSYGVHAPVQLTLRVADAAGQPVATNLSVAVSDAGLAALDPNAETIASNLLLTSDLVGYVENPGYYFRNQTAATAQALDDLLLTQGWRRFVWKQVLAGQPPVVRFLPEQGITLTGQVVSAQGNQPIANSQLTFMQIRPSRNVATGTTNAEGRFTFAGFPLRDTAIISLQARRAQGGSNVIIRPDDGPVPSAQPLPVLPPLNAAPAGVAAFVRRSRQAQAADLELNPEKAIRNIRLENVAVTAKRVKVPADDPRRLYGATGGTIVDFANMPAAQSGMTVLQLLQGRVAGLTVSGNPPNMSVQIRGAGTPLFILDGQRVDIQAISNIPSSEVESVEVFKGVEAAIFGGSGGAIAVYTKRADPNYKAPDTGPAPGIATVKLPGYYQAREFYQPRYNALLTNPPADPRTSTLYWNPSVRTNARGEAELHFFTADGSGSFQAVAEGVTVTGQPAKGTGTVVVREK